MIDVQHVDGRMYFVWLDERLLAAIGWGNTEKIVNDALIAAFAAKYPELFAAPKDDAPS